MTFDLAPEVLATTGRQEALARGESGRFASLAAAREADGLDDVDAAADAAVALGIDEALERTLGEGLEPLDAHPDGPFEQTRVRAVGAAMPVLRRRGNRLELTLPEADLATLFRLVRDLGDLLLARHPASAVTIPMGLGGSGGCAAGECLPEEEPAGPLFTQP